MFVFENKVWQLSVTLESVKDSTGRPVRINWLENCKNITLYFCRVSHFKPSSYSHTHNKCFCNEISVTAICIHLWFDFINMFIILLGTQLQPNALKAFKSITLLFRFAGSTWFAEIVQQNFVTHSNNMARRQGREKCTTEPAQRQRRTTTTTTTIDYCDMFWHLWPSCAGDV